MKTIVGKIILLAAIAHFAPSFVSAAQKIVANFSTADRGAERLTLLTASASIEAVSTPTFGFVGSLRLIERESINPLSLSGRINESPRNTARLPSPESLRFDSTLRAPATSLKSHRTRSG
jgi:hypothetical protein